MWSEIDFWGPLTQPVTSQQEGWEPRGHRKDGVQGACVLALPLYATFTLSLLFIQQVVRTPSLQVRDHSRIIKKEGVGINPTRLSPRSHHLACNTHTVLVLKADITNRSQVLLLLSTKLKGRHD